jgi:hypothetical protein
LDDEYVDSLIVGMPPAEVLELVDLYASLDTFTGQGYTIGSI